MTDSNDNVLPAHGPIGEGVDPLTEGKTTYGREDVKGASTHDDQVPAQDHETDEKVEQTIADQKHVDADTRSAEEKANDSDATEAPDSAPEAEPETPAESAEPTADVPAEAPAEDKA